MNTLIQSIPIPHLCVITAADIEFNAVSQMVEMRSYSDMGGLKQCQGRVGRNLITVLQSEVGAPNFAARLTAVLQETSYDGILIIGLAGALAPNLKTGDVVLYDTCFTFRPQFTTSAETGVEEEAGQSVMCDFHLASSLRHLLIADGVESVFGAGLTLEFMVTSAAEKLSLGESSGAAAVDMESFDVIKVGTQLSLPVVAMRVILDEARQKTPDFNMALNANGQMSPAKSLFAMLLRPFAAIKFLFSLRSAMNALRRAAKLALQVETQTNLPSSALVLARKISG